MSIPSVDFGNRRSRIQRTVNRPATESSTRQTRRRISYVKEQKKPILLDKRKDESSDLESDDNMITVNTPRNLTEVSSDTDSDSDSPPQENQVTWAAQANDNRKEVRETIEPPKTEMKIKTPKRTRVTRKAHLSHNEVFEVKEEEDNNEPVEQKIEIIPEIKKKHNRIESKSTPNTARKDNDVTSTLFNDPSIKIRKNLSHDPSYKALMRESAMILDPIPAEQQIYTVLRHKGSFGKVSFNFLFNDKATYYAVLSKDALSSIFVISTKLPVTTDSSGYQGYVRVSGSRKRFTLVSKYLKPNDDREGCLLGCFFSKNQNGNRTLRITMPPVLSPFFPISRRMELSHVAKSPEKLDRFVYYETEQLPTDLFDADLVEKSIKNFIICDDQKNHIFQFFKASENQFRVKCTAPFNRLMCFGLCIAMIYSKE